MQVSAPIIHASATLGPNVQVSDGAKIGPVTYIDGDVQIGADTKITGNVVLTGPMTIGARCLIESRFSLSRVSRIGELGQADVTVLCDDVHVGAGSSIYAGITVGIGARILAGSAVVRNVPPNAIVGGNPAIILGYVQSSATKVVDTVANSSDAPLGVRTSSVQGVTVHHFERIRDLRGDLCVGEFLRDVPFQPKRYFLVFDVPSAETRGAHAHRTCHQFLVCVGGSVSVVVDDGVRREEIILDRPNLGLHLPPLIWGVQHKYSPDGMLLVFASDYYDASDYIRNYEEFLRERGVRA